MPTYFFDLHADGLSRWDDIGRFCARADDAIGHAKELLLGTLVDNDKPAGLRHAVAVIRDGTGGHFATVTIGADVKMRVVWATGQSVL